IIVKKLKVKILLLPVSLIAVLISHLLVPDQQFLTVNTQYSYFITILIALSIVLIILSFFNKKIFEKLEHSAHFYTALVAFLLICDIITHKYNLLPMPFFPSPV